MASRRAVEAAWDRVVPALSDEGLLLVESSHRVANEMSAAIAAMRLVKSGSGGVRRPEMVDRAIERLEGFAGVVRALAIVPTAPFDLRRGIEELCDGLCAAREKAGWSTVSLDLVEMVVDGETGRRMMMVASELIHNGIRHALEHRSGLLAVVLRGDANEVRLAVLDDGPGMRPDAPTAGTGMGRHIVAELVRRGGGELTVETGPKGTKVRVAMPLGVTDGARLS